MCHHTALMYYNERAALHRIILGCPPLVEEIFTACLLTGFMSTRNHAHAGNDCVRTEIFHNQQRILRNGVEQRMSFNSKTGLSVTSSREKLFSYMDDLNPPDFDNLF